MRRYVIAKRVFQKLDSYTEGEGEETQNISGKEIPELEIEVTVIWQPNNNLLLKKERSTKMTLLDWRQ